MLPTRNLRSNGLFKLVSSKSVANVVNRHLTQQINACCKRNVIGYLMLHSSKCFDKNNDLKPINHMFKAHFSSSGGYPANQELTAVQFEKVSDETLESLTEYFDELIEQSPHLTEADVSYGDGVLTVKFGDSYGTYVINRQTPNKQIWLSSPKSGPKRYDFVDGRWIYKHDGKTMHELLNNEIPAITRDQVCFDKCSYSGKEKEAVLNSL
ncbi:frataxin [Calliopsis andreniformis]|uniref:frataxin n=1 Tax=Calliopsis andreniformis TaxID=337506 RepID=UPI003FCE0E21